MEILATVGNEAGETMGSLVAAGNRRRSLNSVDPGFHYSVNPLVEGLIGGGGRELSLMQVVSSTSKNVQQRGKAEVVWVSEREIKELESRLVELEAGPLDGLAHTEFAGGVPGKHGRIGAVISWKGRINPQ
ncbi:hypothetical protein Salat_0670800 [Sesamum alatum]|uniref:Uncharacterized protein n=1 Tax=Sesamum alatum TaxID=300844 RepID=A0AAE1YR06_9LAMI|nr:hypothetical protein Salat_0670800 [Sesamum alatum]